MLEKLQVNEELDLEVQFCNEDSCTHDCLIDYGDYQYCNAKYTGLL